MKIYLAYSAVGGWSLKKLIEKGVKPLASFHYDKKEITTSYQNIINERRKS